MIWLRVLQKFRFLLRFLLFPCKFLRKDIFLPKCPVLYQKLIFLFLKKIFAKITIKIFANVKFCENMPILVFLASQEFITYSHTQNIDIYIGDIRTARDRTKWVYSDIFGCDIGIIMIDFGMSISAIFCSISMSELRAQYVYKGS